MTISASLLKALALALWLGPLPAWSQVVLIVSAKSPVERLTVEQVAQIYLGQTNRFPQGGTAEPLDQPAGSPQYDDFCLRFLNRPPAQVKAHWTRQAFTGKGRAPAVLRDSADIVKRVAEGSQYLGYVDPAAVDARVKVVKLVRVVEVTKVEEVP